ncbi:isoleucyl-tRNA synthetase [Mycoplasmopsis californica]|uniref:Isoleucine--tRNA ligase n=1 Tax=Mycoplasmopsis californica TaxID=2113 RepID=A0A059XVW9_9BACT|nr:isoleucine--tRNA ligase [Mycoplasmopsis californica]AIA29387.1 isoleucyl-tRNA synthetase [Mycoplasmopsis californica]
MAEKNYKDTLNMPQTNFEMRANLVKKEPEFRELWLQNEIYKKVLAKNKANTPFILHDGPPYANGNLHIGHSLNKILKDIVIRYKSMNGFYTPYIPGWDTHGLPIEHKMLQEAKLNKNELTPLELRRKAREYALSQVEVQKEQFKQMQLLSDFEQYYVTLSPGFVAQQLRLFKKMVLDGLVYKGLKPVYWSPSSQSALAEAEVEYKDIDSPSIFVAFEIEEPGSERIKKGDYLIIWTTTPWTLLANSAVAIGESFEYSIVEKGAKRYIIATELVEKVTDQFNWTNFHVVENLKASEIVGSKYISPLNKNISPVVIGHHVSLETGTGLVHIAPMFGEDDFLIGNKYDLNKIMHISDDGKINELGGEYAGQYYSKADNLIIEQLKLLDLLILAGKINHSYPHDWRTHKPIIFRGTPQWFVSIDKIKDRIIGSLENVSTYPEWAKKRLSNMIINHNDWTISRQRTWGVPLIIFYDQDNKPIFDEKIFDHVINLIEIEGPDIWWEKTADELLPKPYQGKGFSKETDIMDVWFDSGSTSFAVEIDPQVNAPYDLYLEGSDQYRGWFNSSLINSVALRGVAPYKKLVSHGFVLDGKGEKMSKSKGNTIDPLKVIQKHGADILRFWVANSEYTNDVSISDSILEQNADSYRKIRNTIKFILGNLEGFEYDESLPRKGVHQFIKEQLELVRSNVLKAFDEFKFLNGIKLINNYVIELSSFYLNITKDILYVEEFNSINRRMTLTNFYEIVEFLITILAPIIPTTCDDAYRYFNKKDKQISVHLDTITRERSVNMSIINEWEEFFELRDEVNLAIEKAIKEGLIRRSNEVKLTLKPKSDFIASLDLKQLLMVGIVAYGEEFKLETFESLKCQRCWNHFLPAQIIDDLCPLCTKVLKSGDKNE